VQVSTQAKRRRPRLSSELVRIHELRLGEADITCMHGFRVTTPRRTVLDLLHSPAAFGHVEQIACRLLTRSIEGGWEELADRLRHHRRPQRRIALARLLTIHPLSNHQ